MKKLVAMLLTLMMLCACSVQAETAPSVYDVLSALMNGREFTLTVTAEAEGDLADVIAKFGTVTCFLRQENDEILLDVSCEGEKYLRAAATQETVSFETNLIENGAYSGEWAALEPVVQFGADTVNISMTGPDHELIRFTCKITGTDPDDCEAEITIGYITGPGNVHSLWDGITNDNGETSREFYFTFSEEEYAIEGEGTAAAETAEDGTLTITREETCVITYQEDELGEITFRSTLTIR